MPRRRRKLSRRRALIDCRLGHHRFGPGNEAGGGIVRRTCRHCGALSIDLTSVGTSKDPVWFPASHAFLADRTDGYRQSSEEQISGGLFPIETNQPGPG